MRSEERKEKAFFPLFVDVSDKRILMVGAGTISLRRTRTWLLFTTHVTVVAPAICGDFQELPVRLVARRFEEADLDGVDIVCAATDDAALNSHIRELCHARGILVNVASDKEESDFYFPGIVKRGDTVVGVTAGGRDHHLARSLREQIAGLLKE